MGVKYTFQLSKSYEQENHFQKTNEIDERNLTNEKLVNLKTSSEEIQPVRTDVFPEKSVYSRHSDQIPYSKLNASIENLADDSDDEDSADHRDTVVKSPRKDLD